ncbi:MAG: PAS domain-containing hybrid sensor histidine kinase/response regulator [Thermodesulfobacteriota bacterium]
MPWLPPAIIAALASTLVIGGVYGYLFAQERQRFLALWTWGWAFYALRTAFQLLHVTTPILGLPFYLLASELTNLASGLLLMAGSYEFAGRRFQPWWYILGGACALWVAVGLGLGAPDPWLTLPNYLFGGAVFIGTGVVILRSPLPAGAGRRLAGCTFLVWGLHKLDYPFLRPVAWFAPWGYLLAALLSLMAGLGLLLAYFQRARRELEASRSRYQALVESASDGIALFTFDQDMVPNHFQEVNQALCDLLGYTRAELMAMPPRQLLTEAARPAADARTREAAGAGRALFETTLRHANGQPIPVEISSHLLTLDGKPTSLSIVRDIRERRDTQAAMARLAAIVENSEDSIISIGLDGVIQSWNRGAERLYGYTAAEAVGRHMSMAFPPGMQEEPGRILESIGQGRVLRNLEGVRLTKDGREVHVSLNITPVRDAEGRVAGLAAIARDITQQKAQEAERESMRAQLRQAQKMEAVGTLAGGIAHDFNNILGAIMGYTEMAMQQVSPDGPLWSDLEQVLKAGERAKDLVGQILAFSRRAEQEPRALRLTPLVKEAHKLLQATLPGHVELSLAILTEDDLVLADPTQIHQVVMNLCTNAVQAMGPRRGRVELRLEQAAPDEADMAARPDLGSGPFLRLSVSDDGPGMEPQVLERVFDPFFTTKRPGEGTGLGLAVAHGIAQAHGGLLTARSQPGRGATFSLYLPRRAGAAEPAPPSEDGLPRGCERLLLVDDESALVDIAGRLLTSLGYAVSSRSNSTLALDDFRAAPLAFDLLITDYNMPGMSGLELARRIQAVRPGLPVILCTGYGHQLEREELAPAGVREVLAKPVLARQLAQAVRRVLDVPAAS